MLFISYSLRSEHFTINSTTGELSTIKPIDRESLSLGWFEMTVIAYDFGVPSLHGTTTVNITVKDLNDNKPIFTNMVSTVHILEGLEASRIFHNLTVSILNILILK